MKNASGPRADGAGPDQSTHHDLCLRCPLTESIGNLECISALQRKPGLAVLLVKLGCYGSVNIGLVEPVGTAS